MSLVKSAVGLRWDLVCALQERTTKFNMRLRCKQKRLTSGDREFTRAGRLHNFGLEVLNVSSLSPSKSAAQSDKGAACATSQDAIENFSLATVRNFWVPLKFLILPGGDGACL